MKRVFDDNGFWTDDAMEGIRLISPMLSGAFEALETSGFNPREAGLILHDELYVLACERMITRKRDLSKK